MKNKTDKNTHQARALFDPMNAPSAPPIYAEVRYVRVGGLFNDPYCVRLAAFDDDRQYTAHAF